MIHGFQGTPRSAKQAARLTAAQVTAPPVGSSTPRFGLGLCCASQANFGTDYVASGMPRTAAPRAVAAVAISIAAAGPMRVPILMYHYIRVNPVARDKVGADLSVSPQRFSQEMQYLAANGYHTITFDMLAGAVKGTVRLPARPVLLTFDDGYEDFFTSAYPVLKQFGFHATSFVITGKVGQGGYLTWDQMRAMQAGGLAQFESHTVNHVEMDRISLSRAQSELVNSKATLEMQLGTQVKYFCYPSGHYDSGVEKLVAKDGYVAAVSTHAGVATGANNIDALPRVRVHGGESLATFAGSLGRPAASTP
ncbi:MAG: polysaccharide deacetylase family protein [Chloroflexi bacterium]|nr:polysaccharide deacetylase family protein [Chloroflexota bacterium]